MKPTDSRHQQRLAKVQAAFAFDFSQDSNFVESSHQEYISGLQSAIPHLDERIAAVATERPISEINPVDRAILRVILYESETESTPPAVLTDEAVELAKALGSERSPQFVNGVLGKLLFDQ